MSSSTASITAASPITYRRRALASVENTTFSGENVGTVAGKDLVRSIVSDSVLERSRNLLQVNKTLPGVTPAAVSPRRTRKVVSKKDKPRWETAVSVLTKNLLLLFAVLGFFQMIRKLVLNSGDNLTGMTNLGESLDLERRIAETESLLKVSTKMMQDRVDDVDRKIGKEILGLRSEFGKKIEDNGITLEKDLKKMEDRTDDLEKSLGKLKEMNFMSKEEFNIFYDELQKEKGNVHGDRDMSLDDMRFVLREMINVEFEKHGADGLGRVDYASASGGGMVVSHSDPFIVGKGSGWFSKGTIRNGVSSDAEKMLRPSFGEPGQCFPLKGATGFVQIRLRTAIVPEAITLEHVAKSAAYDRSSAPKDCRVSGWLQGEDTDLDGVEGNMFHLVDFTYDLGKRNIQTFNVVEGAGPSVIIDTLRLDFTSNYGSPSHTCIYRLRVHGREASSISMLAIQS